MRHTLVRCFRTNLARQSSFVAAGRPPVIQINNGTFYRQQPSLKQTEGEARSNRPLFPNLEFIFPADNEEQHYWAVIGPSNAGKTTFLEILRGHHLCFPPAARSYPYLSTNEIAVKDHGLRHPSRAIQYVGFNGRERGLSGYGNYLSARYESRREATDFSLLEYLQGNTALNTDKIESVDEALLAKVMTDLRLSELASMPLSNLSNGQTRRARIAKALLGKPELLLLDEPFMGLDPPTMHALSPQLYELAKAKNPRLLLTLRPQDPIPDWITHILYLGKDLKVTHQGPKHEVGRLLREEEEKFRKEYEPGKPLAEMPRYHTEFGRSLEKVDDTNSWRIVKDEMRASGDFITGNAQKEPLIEMEGVTVKYGNKLVLGDWCQELPDRQNDKNGLFWTVRRGERWGVFGPNGCGKTTLIAMITSDHPQAYSQPLKLFGRSRLPTIGIPGISVFELQSRIGHSSPEVHAFFPRSLSVRATIESAYADTPLVPPSLTAEADRRVDACLRWFQGDLNPALGMNRLLAEESLRTQKAGRKDYVREGNVEVYKEASRQYWYDHETEQTESIEWADNMLFGELPFSAQRLALFLRAIVKAPDLIVLDEAFGGMDDVLREKCLLFLEKGESHRLSPFIEGGFEYDSTGWRHRKRGARAMRDAAITEGLTDRQTLICVSHVKEEVPWSVRNWMFLPEGGSGRCVRMGKFDRQALISTRIGVWEAIWGVDWRTLRSQHHPPNLKSTN